MPKERTRKAAAAAAAKPERNQRRKKDPNAPKRGLSAYMFFANDNRDKVREENEGISFGAVGKELGRLWKEMDDKPEDKQVYLDKAAEDKERYEKEMAAYKKKLEAAADAGSDSERSDRD